MSPGRTVLVTGGAGFMGSHFVEHHLDAHPSDRVIVLDALTYAATLENVAQPQAHHAARFEFVHGNVRSPAVVDALMARSDVVVHFAAETHVPRSISDSLMFVETDVLGTQTVASAVVRHRDRIERFIHVSTSEVYGGAPGEVMEEGHPLRPMTPYAAAKCGADRLVFAFAQTYEVPAVIVRPFNNYGPRQHLEKLVPRMVTSALLDEPLTVHGDGGATRDWIHVRDTCRALEAVLDAPIEGVRGEVFNAATGVATSVLEIAERVLALVGRDGSAIVHTPERPGQVTEQRASTKRAHQALGFEAETRLDAGLAATVAWYREHRSWWERLRFMRAVPVTGGDGGVTYW